MTVVWGPGLARAETKMGSFVEQTSQYLDKISIQFRRLTAGFKIVERERDNLFAKVRARCLQAGGLACCHAGWLPHRSFKVLPRGAGKVVLVVAPGRHVL